MGRFAIESRSARQTKAWGRRLASMLTGGELLALVGDLGAGKTCFVKGLARGLDLDEKKILSPTFTMIQEHHGRLVLYHIDLYRLEQARLDDLGLREYLFSAGVAAVEWFERLREAPGLDCLSIHFGFAGANTRLIEFSAQGSRYLELLNRLQARFG
ncbi:MAG TPA: tRNA (adenosine(37)-N6)-threonylcarbamoyltransferase complex ATPase subunit type 1 TsaE [Candidatus Binataceae bacterium]|jgi:tRNA threonylcarbamoyladenosine biosynthesis protein TsaE|nr:tRNA (adenosine(37)-N6)-threonylcarbamoyltransferase complex ATPase subunit type 1 TsaE [Candidatus Binataceae bacterium]